LLYPTIVIVNLGIQTSEHFLALLFETDCPPKRLVCIMRGGTFFKMGGGTSNRQKYIENLCGLNWQL